MLYNCPQLTAIFTFNLLQNLHNLEELVVEDCLKINNIVTHDFPLVDKSSSKVKEDITSLLA